MRDAVVIRSPDGRAAATVCPDHGAQVASLIAPVGGVLREVFYRRASFWESIVDGGGLPYLFPVVGRHRVDDRPGVYRWRERTYDMPMHGFSLTRAWSVTDAGPHHVALQLRADTASRAVFPFSFEVTLTYRLENDGLSVHQAYDGSADGGFPLAAGFHPYLALLPAEVEACTINGPFAEIGTYNATYTDISRWELAGACISVAEAARGSRVVRLSGGGPVQIRVNGKPWMTMDLGGGYACAFRYLQFYRSGSDPFVCIEPWMDLPNALNRGCALVTDRRDATFALRW
jgi:galactose mutarotase-like enzyme